MGGAAAILLWGATQLVPSPQWTLPERGDPRFGLRWQVTPLLFSVGIRRGLSPWRAFLVEPNVRHSGSFELFFSPEYTFAPGPFEHGLGARVGARMYVPLVQAGEYLSCSAGASAIATWQGISGAIEAGLYTLFGGLGLQVTHAPDPSARTTTLTISLRYF